ncbi:MAG: hypothetical protein LC662_11860 [Rhodothermaceae bacterium]|nr:hypothetical protein [Rhodothermaceae bacterium]
MSSKRVLIITYYWPPTGASGVQRWLKFAKYLPENGWIPVIYTPENPERPAIDHSLEADIPAGAEIITHPIFEPYGLYKKLTGRKADESIQVGFVSDAGESGLLENVSRWLRGNCLIPDARRFWIRPSVRRLTAVDPWSRFYYNNDLLFNSRTRRKQLKLEQSVLRDASRVVTVSSLIRDELQQIGERSVDVIHNGYDPADYENLKYDASSSFVIAHTGAFQPAANPEKVWQVLSRLVQTDSSLAGDLKIVLVGKVDSAIKECISRNGLDAWVQYVGYVPHAEVMRYQITSALLLLCILRTEGAEGIITGKFFEYLASGTPVMCVGPENGDTAAIIRECNAGDTAGFDDSEAMEKIITGAYRKWKTGERHLTDKNAILRYSRREQTRVLAGMLNEITTSTATAH